MKASNYFLFPILILTLASCSSDPCEEVTCLNGGVCVEGTCDCPPGWKGEDCSIYDFNYVGSYTSERYTNTGCNDPLNNGNFQSRNEGEFCFTIDSDNRDCWVRTIEFKADQTWEYRLLTTEYRGGIINSRIENFGGTYETNREVITLFVEGADEEVDFKVADDRTHIMWEVRPSQNTGCQTTHFFYRDN